MNTDKTVARFSRLCQPLDAKMTDSDMDNNELLEDCRRAKESVEYFSQDNKSEREKWVCAKFLSKLSIEFDDSEIYAVIDQPPDVRFRDAHFEIKEILDPARRRHAEYKMALQKALAATDPQELLNEFTPEDITPLQVAARVSAELRDLETHYARAVRANLDLLFYVNLEHHFLKPGSMPEVNTFDAFGWRSVSAVIEWGGLVFCANKDAPEFLRSKAGTLTQRRFE